jgi:hypothetical protein
MLPEPPPFRKWLDSPGLVLALLLGLALLWAAQASGQESFGILFRVATIALSGLWCVSVAFRASVSVCREREQRTLEALLLLPVERTEILRAKWLRSVLRGRLFGYGLAALWFEGLVSGTLHPWAVLLQISTVAGCVAVLASLGIWLSLASRNRLWANLTMALFLLLLFGASWIRANVDALSSYQPASATWIDNFLDVGLNPLRALWVVGFSWRDLVNSIRKEDVLFGSRLTAILAGEVLFGVAAWVLWKVACVRFGRETAQSRNAAGHGA